MNLDRAWFKKHSGRNARVRLPGPGEVEQVFRHSHPAAAREIESLGGSVPAPSPEFKWCIAVINVAPDTLIKMLVLRPAEWTGCEPENGWAIYAAAFAGSFMIEKIGG